MVIDFYDYFYERVYQNAGSETVQNDREDLHPFDCSERS